MAWFVRTCDEQYNHHVTIVCQTRLPSRTTQSIMSQNPNFSCEKQYFQISDNSKCYRMISSPPTITFDAAAKYCFLLNSSLFNLPYGGKFSHKDTCLIEKWVAEFLLSRYYKKISQRENINHTHPL